MHTLARSPVREAHLKRQARLRAFTLIELLTVIAIIAILAAITFGVVKGVNERAAVAQAKSELSSLSQALEAYKLQYGDYPQTGSFTAAGVNASPALGSVTTTNAQAILLNALVGKAGPKGSVLRRPGGKSLVELSKFTLETVNLPAFEPTPVTSDVTLVSNSFVDPWGRRYMYFYKNKDTPADWKGSSFILYSAGPDGLETNGSQTNPTSASALNFKTIGVLNAATLILPNNSDNIWAN
jgi:prepilin-type N-terminal cleavage/methylation domain-containing protein